ncbi:hypothetical protein [Mesorhizobium sp. ANAO-SY3R2]|uniref:hypothetical protein n=1 Tax=Mesorhizobium sp. ANAO-SY3R2 TaxID=3166644 RepID=UPI003671B432
MTKYECQDCGTEFTQDDMDADDGANETGFRSYIHHISERVSPGEPMPAGQCNHCGALVHLVGDAETAPDEANETIDALVQAEAFIAGFKDDATQIGVADILAGLRAAMKREQAAPVMLAALKAIKRARGNCGASPFEQAACNLMDDAIAMAEGQATLAGNAAKPQAHLDLLAVLKLAVTDWPQFDAEPALRRPGCQEDGDGDVNGGDLVEWFGNWRRAFVLPAIAHAEGRANV